MGVSVRIRLMVQARTCLSVEHSVRLILLMGIIVSVCYKLNVCMFLLKQKTFTNINIFSFSDRIRTFWEIVYFWMINILEISNYFVNKHSYLLLCFRA